MSSRGEYERIAPIYDLIDLAELTFKRKLRHRLFEGLGGRRSGFASDCFDAAVAAFVFGSLDHDMQALALAELARVCRPGAEIRLLDHAQSRRRLPRLYMRLWRPWERLVYGADFDRETECYVASAGLRLIGVDDVLGDTVRLTAARAV